MLYHQDIGTFLCVWGVCVGVCVLYVNKKSYFREFPDGPVVKTSSSNGGGSGSIPSQGAKTPHLAAKKIKA